MRPSGIFSKTNVYLLRNGSDFDKAGQTSGEPTILKRRFGAFRKQSATRRSQSKIPRKTLDLVLQDIVLDKEGKLHGSLTLSRTISRRVPKRWLL